MDAENYCRISGLQAMTKWVKCRGFAVNCGFKTNRTCLRCRANILILDLETLIKTCQHCGEKHEREFVNVSQWTKNIPSKKWKTIKVRQGHKGWLTVKLVTCRVRAKIDSHPGLPPAKHEVGDEEMLIVSKWREDNGKARCDYL